MTTIPRLTYPDAKERNPAFDVKTFYQRWCGRLGSVHRYYLTGELILLYPRNDLRSDERRQLQAELETHPGNIGSLLTWLDERNEAHNRRVQEANAHSNSGVRVEAE